MVRMPWLRRRSVFVCPFQVLITRAPSERKTSSKDAASSGRSDGCEVLGLPASGRPVVSKDEDLRLALARVVILCHPEH